jgi:hypothetical protein
MGMDEYIGGTLGEYKEKINEYIEIVRGKLWMNRNEERAKIRARFLEFMEPMQFMEEYEEVLVGCVEEYKRNNVIKEEDDHMNVKDHMSVKKEVSDIDLMNYIRKNGLFNDAFKK